MKQQKNNNYEKFDNKDENYTVEKRIYYVEDDILVNKEICPYCRRRLE